MTSWYIAKAEWLRLWRNRLGKLAILAALFVPLLYCGLYLYAFWDPYGSLDKLPVALVNEDHGAIYEGARENFGNDLMDEVQEKIDVDWHVVNRVQAQQGVEGDEYFLAIIIPSDFTERSLSITTANPVKAKLHYIRNEGKNYVAGQIANRIENELSVGIGKKFTQQYISNIFDLISESKTGLTKAANAANQIAIGAEKISESSMKIQEAIGKTAFGSKKLLVGMNTLQQAAIQLENGAKQVREGNNQLADLVDRLKVPLQQAQKLVEQFQQSGAGNRIQAISQRMDELDQRYQQIKQDWQQLTASQPQLADNPIAKQIDERIGGTLGQIQTLRAEVAQLRDSLKNITGGKPFSIQDLDQVRVLANGSEKVYQGLVKFRKGVNELQGGMSQLTKGLNELNRKLPEFVAGAKKVAESNRDLASKLGDAVASTQADSKKLAEVVSDPIDTEDKSLHQVSEYGVGLAPYFLPLSLWVGTIILYFTLPMDEKRWKFGPYRLGLVPVGQFLSLYPIGICQSLLTGAVMHYGLGLPIELGVAYYLFLICISLMSITLIGFFIGTFGDGPGRLIAIITLVLQLVSSGGTFPTELIPEPLQKISGYLPMYYGVRGLRNIIALNRPEEMAPYFITMLSFLGLALLGSILIQRRSVRFRDLQHRDHLEAG